MAGRYSAMVVGKERGRCPLSGARRGRPGRWIAPACLVARRFGRATAAGPHLVVPAQPVEGQFVRRPPHDDRAVVLIGSGIFSGPVWAWHGFGREGREISPSSGGHDVCHRYPVVADRVEIGLAVAGMAASPEIPWAHEPFSGAGVYGVGAEDRLRRGPFAGWHPDLRWSDLAGTGSLCLPGGRGSRLCGRDRPIRCFCTAAPDIYGRVASARATEQENREHRKVEARATSGHQLVSSTPDTVCLRLVATHRVAVGHFSEQLLCHP